jgi:hypothetical protein
MRGFLGSLISDPQCPRTTPTRLCRWRPALDVYPEIEFDGGGRLSVAFAAARLMRTDAPVAVGFFLAVSARAGPGISCTLLSVIIIDGNGKGRFGRQKHEFQAHAIRRSMAPN